MPATDDEIMEVEDFLVDDKTEIQVATDTEKTVECISIEGSACGKLQLEDSDGYLLYSFLLTSSFICSEHLYHIRVDVIIFLKYFAETREPLS